MNTPTTFNPDSLRRIMAYATHYWKHLTLSILFASLYGAFSAAPSYLVQHMVDWVFVGKMDHLLAPLILGFLALFAFKGLFMYFSAYYMNHVGYNVVNDIRYDLFKSIIHFPVSFFRQLSTGRIMSLFLNDITLIQNACSSAVRKGIRGLCEATFLLCVAFMQSWKLTLLMLMVGPLIFITIKRMTTAVRAESRIMQSHMGVLSALLQEILIGIREIKACNSETTEKKRFSQNLATYFTSTMRCIHYGILAPAITEVIAMSGIGIVLYVAARQVLSGTMTPGQLSSFFAAVLLAYQPIKRLIVLYSDSFYALGAADRVFEVMDKKFKQNEDRTIVLPGFTDAIRLESLSFSYNDEQTVLRDVNLTIKKGERIGIIGPSGAGKSTLCDLLMGFISPTRGRITIDGTDMRTTTFKSLREQIGYVGQQTFLFNDTVRANVAYAQPTALQDEIEVACKAAHAHEFITKLPKNYLSMVGENGSQLSGGQKQRLTIARALLKNPSILIFDEATSALDQTSQDLIKQAIDELDRDKTMIIISHRTMFVEHLDRVFTLRDGRLFEIEGAARPAPGVAGPLL